MLDAVPRNPMQSDFEILLGGGTDFESMLGCDSPLDTPLAVTWFKGTFDDGADERQMTVRELARQIAMEHAPKKAGLNAIKLARFGHRRTYGDAGLLRNNDNVIAVSGVEAEHDAGSLSLDDAESRLRAAGLAALLVSTSSHKPDAPHWRVFLPVANEAAPDQRAALAARVNGIFDGELDQHATFTLSQLQYVGSVAGGLPVDVRLIDGRPLDLAADLDCRALPKGSRRSADGDVAPAPTDEATILASIASGESYHPAFLQFAGKCAKRGDTEESCLKRLQAEMDKVPEDQRDRRWQDRMKHLPATVNDIFASEVRKCARQGDDDLALFDDDLPEEAPPSDTGEGADIEHGSLVQKLNRKHALIIVGGKSVIAAGGVKRTPSFWQPRAFHDFYANKRVEVTDPATKKPKRVPVSQIWMAHSERRTYSGGIAFAPEGASGNCFNLWRGWGVTADPAADCHLFLDHLRNVVCNGEAELFDYACRWLAHMVQRPAEKPGVALVLRGLKGTGKDVIGRYLSKMIGSQHVVNIAQQDHLLGKFNEHLQAALLVHVEEAVWAGSRAGESVLKNLITAPTLTIERKGVDACQARSVLRIMMSSNESWTVPASADERRFAVFDVSARRRGDADYFAALHAEMDGEGPAALLHFLQTFDLDGFNVRAAPESAGLTSQKIASLRGVSLWWFEALQRGETPGAGYLDDGRWDSDTQRVACDLFRDNFNEWARKRRHESEVNSVHFGKQMHEMLPALRKEQPRAGGSRMRRYVFPTLAECRRAFETCFKVTLEWEEYATCTA